MRELAISGLLALAMLPGSACHRFQARAAEAGNRNGTLNWRGLTRQYFVHVPESYRGKPVALVIVLHGATQSPESIERMSRISETADRETFLAVYPRGIGRLPTWNAGACCGSAMEQHVDDVGFIEALIGKIERDYAVDPKRIFATGISNGGMLSYRLGCELAGKIAAIAPVEGAQDLDCRPSNPVSVIIFHGTADRLVPFEGGRTPFQAGPRRSDTSVASSVAFWVKQDGCSAAPEHDDSDAVQVERYSGCRDGSGVERYAIQGGRHIWPGTRFSRNDIPATELMWSFFNRHPKP